MNQTIIVHVSEELALLCSIWNQNLESLIKHLIDHATPDMLKDVDAAHCLRPDGTINVRSIGKSIKKTQEHEEKFEYDPAYLATAICVSAYGYEPDQVWHGWPPYNRPLDSDTAPEP